jgi:hypothetical protein
MASRTNIGFTLSPAKPRTLYTGMTGDLFVRIMQHKAGEFEGFAKTHGCKRLVCFESFDNVHNAIIAKNRSSLGVAGRRLDSSKRQILAGMTWLSIGVRKCVCRARAL